MIVNDPCVFCIHLYDDSDPSVGLYGTGCDSEVAEDWVQGQGEPCPGFQPQLASDGLLEQLSDEMEARWEAERDEAMKEELVDHPAYYGGSESPYETIKVIEAWGLDFCLGNALKYISRAGKKDPTKEAEDLRKAVWYVERRIHQLEGEE